MSTKPGARCQVRAPDSDRLRNARTYRAGDTDPEHSAPSIDDNLEEISRLYRLRVSSQLGKFDL